MFDRRDCMERFDGLLARLDALAADCDGGAAEDLEDLNAEFEDALMLLGEWKPGDDPEELAGTLEDLRALAGDYRALPGGAQGLADLAGQLEQAADAALGGLGR